jgi:hypothetical protein
MGALAHVDAHLVVTLLGLPLELEGFDVPIAVLIEIVHNAKYAAADRPQSCAYRKSFKGYGPRSLDHSPVLGIIGVTELTVRDR